MEKRKIPDRNDCGVCSCHSTCRAWLCADEDQAESAHGSCSRRCLPASKMLVEFITIAPHQSIEKDIYQEIEAKASLLKRVYDLVITSPEKVMPVDAIVISGHTVIGYASNTKTDEVTCARYLKDMLNANHHEKMTVKIFHDYKAFLSRVEGMNNIVEVGHTENGREDRAVRKLILSTCM